MASPLVSRVPQCISCIRQIAGLRAAFRISAGHQTRGKKKLAKVTTVNVHLLQNVPGYGKKGTVVPVTTGVMRNIWYPKNIAEYVTASKAEELGIKKATAIERDYTFKSNAERRYEKEHEEQLELESEERVPASESTPKPTLQAADTYNPGPQAAPIKLDLLSPAVATSLLEELLPPNLNFFRVPISVAAPQPARRTSPSIAAAAAVSEAAKPTSGEKSDKAGKRGIYGSVSTADIAANLKAILAEDAEGARVTLSSNEIKFVGEVDEQDRVKTLGIYEVEIKLNGASDSVRRTIQVNAQD